MNERNGLSWSRKRLLWAALLVVGAGILLYFLPPVRERVDYRVEAVRSVLKYAINPPEKEIFIPEGLTRTPRLTPSFTPATPTPTSTATPTRPGPTPTPTLSPTPTVSPTPLPGSTALKGVRFQSQRSLWNYCAPANLAMALSFWGWQGDRLTVGRVVKPYDKDKNVMLYEMQNYVSDTTKLSSIVRYAGDLGLLKTFIANGFPVLMEKGEVLHGEYGPGSEGWMGHYEVFTGYNEAGGYLIGQDSLTGPNARVLYPQIPPDWRAFNYAYMVIYPPEKEAQVLAILGADADPTANLQRAATLASKEIYVLTGRDQFFAWYNRGTSLMYLQDYTGAAGAYDQAFSSVYPSIPEKDRPWRMLWYQTGPYFAYYYTGRYTDVIQLATQTLDAMADPILEESYYWRAMAEAALGDKTSAVNDLRQALLYHAGFPPALQELQALGVSP